MALPGQTLTVTDGGIGVALPAADRILVVGTSSAGTANTISSYASSSAVVATAGYGPGPDTVGHILDIAGGTVDFLKTAATVAAANGTVTHTGTGIALMTVSGTANNDLSVLVTIVAGGTLGVGTFKYTLENDASVSAPAVSETLTIPAGGTYLVPNTGLTLTFATGTYIAGDTFGFTSTCATYNGADLDAAKTVLLATTTRYKFIVFAGTQASGATAATVAASVSGWLTSLANQFRFVRAIVHTGNDTEANVNTAFAAFTDARQMLVASFAHLQVPNKIQGRVSPSVPFTMPVAARAARCKISTSPAWVGFPGGALPGVSVPKFDERVSGETIHQNKINGPTTLIGQAGVFLVDALLKSTAGSDFKFWQWGLVIDRMCQTIVDVQAKYVNSFVRALTDGTGRIDPRDSARINADVRGQLKSALLDEINDQGSKGHVSDFAYAVDETNNILSTGILQSAGSAVPLPNISSIATSVGFKAAIQPSA